MKKQYVSLHIIKRNLINPRTVYEEKFVVGLLYLLVVFGLHCLCHLLVLISILKRDLCTLKRCKLMMNSLKKQINYKVKRCCPQDFGIHRLLIPSQVRE